MLDVVFVLITIAFSASHSATPRLATAESEPTEGYVAGIPAERNCRVAGPGVPGIRPATPGALLMELGQ